MQLIKQASPEPELLTIAQAAARFGIGRSVIYHLLDARRLSRYETEFGRARTYIDADELRAISMPRVTTVQEQANNER